MLYLWFHGVGVNNNVGVGVIGLKGNGTLLDINRSINQAMIKPSGNSHPATRVDMPWVTAPFRFWKMTSVFGNAESFLLRRARFISSK
jgi:hypothetical protein